MKPVSARTCFVTGASGFLGNHVVRQLVKQGYFVRALVRPGADVRLLEALPIEWVPGDLLQPSTYGHALTGCATVFHLAAMFTANPALAGEMEAVNVEGTRLLLTTAMETGTPKVVHVSTIGTIGQPGDGSLATEDTAFNLPYPSPYVLSKLAGERVALAMAADGADIVVVHPTGMLGPGDWRPTASGRRVRDFVQGRAPAYPAGGVNWCPVQDVAQGLILAAERGAPGRRYILGHCQGNFDLSGFLDLLSRASGLPIPRLPEPNWRQRLARRLHSASALASASASASARPDTTPDRLTCDPRRAIEELGMPQTSLLSAAAAAVAWYRGMISNG